MAEERTMAEQRATSPPVLRDHRFLARFVACGVTVMAVLGGGVSPGNAAEQVAHAGVRSGVMVLLGSAAYAEGSPTDAVRGTVSSFRPNTALEIA